LLQGHALVISADSVLCFPDVIGLLLVIDQPKCPHICSLAGQPCLQCLIFEGSNPEVPSSLWEGRLVRLSMQSKKGLALQGTCLGN